MPYSKSTGQPDFSADKFNSAQSNIFMWGTVLLAVLGAWMIEKNSKAPSAPEDVQVKSISPHAVRLSCRLGEGVAVSYDVFDNGVLVGSGHTQTNESARLPFIFTIDALAAGTTHDISLWGFRGRATSGEVDLTLATPSVSSLGTKRPGSPTAMRNSAPELGGMQ